MYLYVYRAGAEPSAAVVHATKRLILFAGELDWSIDLNLTGYAKFFGYDKRRTALAIKRNGPPLLIQAQFTYTFYW